MEKQFLLFESSAGYALFKREGGDEVAVVENQNQKSITELNKFSSIVKLHSFIPFPSAETALQNLNDVSEGVLNTFLKEFLKTNLSKKSFGNATLGVADPALGAAIQEGTGISVERTKATLELLRGIRLHLPKFIPELGEKGLEKTQLGLGHSYSRSKVKFNIHKVDNMIIQSISLLDQLDKDLNTFSMRCREWYSWHFPELQKIVPDHYQFAKLVKLIGDKSQLTEERLPAMIEILQSEEKAQEILNATRTSFGTDISPIDLINIERFADRVIELSEYRQHLHSYLLSKMNTVAPNLSALIGELVGARLISHAGSLTNLAKLPASTVQILGAEKALFRALRARTNTPKYGLIFHSSFIGKADKQNKGRISRYVANKCSIASRIDCFSENSTTVFGSKLREQVEERLKFFVSGETPQKNIDVMHQAIQEADKEIQQKQPKKRGMDETREKSKKKKKAKQSTEAPPQETSPEVPEEMAEEEAPKKKKKKQAKAESQEEKEQPVTPEAPKKAQTPPSTKAKKKSNAPSPKTPKKVQQTPETKKTPKKTPKKA